MMDHINLFLQVNALIQEIFSRDELPHHQPLVQYTGEKFGVEYLYHHQSSLPSKQEQVKEDTIDEGIWDECMYLLSFQGVGDELSEDVSTFALIYEESEDKEACIHVCVGHAMILSY